MRIPRRLGAGAAIAVPLVMLVGGAATAAGATVFTDVEHGVVEVFSDVNPCTGDPGTVSTVANEVFHGTLSSTGSWFTGTVEGQFTFVPNDASKPSYTGHFSTWFGDDNNLRNGTEQSTFTIVGVGSDGSRLRFHDNAVATTNAQGKVTVDLDHMTCAVS